MDIFAHALWSFLVFGRFDYWEWAIFFGVMPDLLSFGSLFVQKMFIWKMPIKKMSIEEFPKYVLVMYDLAHSLAVCIMIFFIIFFVFDFFPLFLFAWPLHIFMDIPLHEKNFFGTKFFYPFLDYRINGWSWSIPMLMVANYLLIFLGYLIAFVTGWFSF